ncbi:hypothetical protein CCYA_CCYA03G1130 [Cyanidiococcus yangmingshanensis]|nr:hypothetical protein CCYA_CCYA03G1130 [Cyanidiococcus yangmingshanensis]
MFLTFPTTLFGRSRWHRIRRDPVGRTSAGTRKRLAAVTRRTPLTLAGLTPKPSTEDTPAAQNWRERLVIVGLGNPGAAYEKTRHNAGFLAVDVVAQGFRAPTFRCCDAWQALHTQFNAGKEVHLLKPITFMNRSGEALRSFLRDAFGNEFASKTDWSAHVLVLVDDTALPFGRMRLRLRGSDGGHNGLKSIAQALGTERYARLRIGIGGDLRRGNGSAVDYVLGSFTRAEWHTLQETVLIDCIRVVREWIECDNLAQVVQFCNAASGSLKARP